MEVNFKVSARHIGQIGRELVTDYVTALVELVKNSYDADSEGVKIIFDKIKTDDGTILIVDTGSGMTTEDVKEKWTVIGTNNKLRNTYSKKGRKLAGKKGIGRFSVERLAEMATIYSFSEEDQPFKFKVNWNMYEEINIYGIKQRIVHLKNNENNIDSAKFLKRQIEYFLSNTRIDQEDKDRVVDEILNGEALHYKLFFNKETLSIVELILLPILEKYQDELIKVEDVFHKIEYLDDKEREINKNLISSVESEINIIKNNSTGIIIKLEGLRDQWTQRDLIKVQKELRLLVSPTILNSQQFIPILEANEFKLEKSIIVNDILKLNFARITGEIKNNGKNGFIRYEENKSGKVDEDEIVYDENPLRCGDIELELFYFIRDRENLTNSELNVTHARQLLDEFSGIKIYRDGFHVRPYGDKGNDWLYLDHKKVMDTHAFLVGNNQVIGVINISEDTNPLLVDATNREGIIENEAFDDLKRFVVQCTNFISMKRREFALSNKIKDEYEKVKEKKKQELRQKEIEEEKKKQIRLAELEKKRKELEEIAAKEDLNPREKIDTLTKYTSELHNKSQEDISFYMKKLEQERKENEDFNQKTEDYYQQQLNNKERELSLYKNLATLGMLTGAFGHETADVINRIGVDIEYTKRGFPAEVIKNKPEIVDAYNNIMNDFERIQGYSNLIVNFVRKKKREELNNINPKEIIESVVNSYFKIIKSQNIEIELMLSSFMTNLKMFTIDFESIIINMLTNSFEALKGTTSKKIIISCEETEENYEFLIEDNGKGIKEGSEERIFSPFITTKPNGIGLGLSIVNDIITNYKGRISAFNSNKHGGAVFKFKFPKGDSD